MLKKEFEDRTGTEVSSEDFEIIHQIYMATGEMDKDTFCKNWNPKFLENPIVATLTVGTARWIKASMDTQEALNKANKDLDRSLHTVQELTTRCEVTKRHLDKFVDAIDATVDIINLSCFEALKKKLEDIFGKTHVMRMRINHGWDLSKEEVSWLLNRIDDDSVSQEEDDD
jgi:hypothetical protein